MEIKILNWLIKKLEAFNQSISNAIEELVYMKYVHELGEKEDDIYVATYLKSGTTWMQMILYQMVTDGNTDFKHIYDVSPWLRNLASRRGKLPENLPSPRIIKMHDAYFKVPKRKPGRFIYVIRDGIDVANSLWHHRMNYNNPKMTFEENFNTSFEEPGAMNWFDFNKNWLGNANKHKVLYVQYEKLQSDFKGELYRIASFLGISLNDEVLSRIKERASFTFMKQHEKKFGEQPPEEKIERIYNQFIRSGKTGEGYMQMSDENLQSYFNALQQIEQDNLLIKDYCISAAKEMQKRPFFHRS